MTLIQASQTSQPMEIGKNSPKDSENEKRQRKRGGSAKPVRKTLSKSRKIIG